MKLNSSINRSFLISAAVHGILLLLFFLIKITLEYPTPEFVEVGFGTFGKASSSGAKGAAVRQINEAAKVEEAKKAELATKVVKEVELPKTQNTEEANVATRAENKKEKESVPKSEAVAEKTKSETPNSNNSNDGSGNMGEGNGSFGYDIDWGGKGMRKIYSYRLPDYPEGVSKSIDVKLRFTILPDGTVGTIRPLIKADSRLEMAAINSLRQWRFEPLKVNQQQTEQTAVIVFPYRLQ